LTPIAKKNPKLVQSQHACAWTSDSCISFNILHLHLYNKVSEKNSGYSSGLNRVGYKLAPLSNAGRTCTVLCQYYTRNLLYLYTHL